MTSKKLNRIFALVLVLFCVIFAVVFTQQESGFAVLDAEHDAANAAIRDQYIQDTAQNNSTNTSNQNNNNGQLQTPFDPNDTSGNNNRIPTFSNFVEMYSYAEAKLNNATNIHSRATGTLSLSGPITGGSIGFMDLTLENDVMQITAERAKNETQSYFNFILAGDMLDGLAFIEYNTATYAEGTSSFLFTNITREWSGSSEQAIYDMFNWETNQTFHIINNDSVLSSTYTYDASTQLHTGTVVLNTDISAERSKHIYSGVSGGNSPGQFHSASLTVTVDKYGNFKSIDYKESFYMEILNLTYGSLILAECVTNYTETFFCIDSNPVLITPPAGLPNQ